MGTEDVSLLLAVLGGTTVTSSWLGRRAGNAPRDVRLMLVIGCCMLAGAAALFFM